jgi:hypothetical protein
MAPWPTGRSAWWRRGRGAARGSLPPGGRDRVRRFRLSRRPQALGRDLGRRPPSTPDRGSGPGAELPGECRGLGAGAPDGAAGQGRVRHREGATGRRPAAGRQRPPARPRSPGRSQKRAGGRPTQEWPGREKETWAGRIFLDRGRPRGWDGVRLGPPGRRRPRKLSRDRCVAGRGASPLRQPFQGHCFLRPAMTCEVAICSPLLYRPRCGGGFFGPRGVLR